MKCYLLIRTWFQYFHQKYIMKKYPRRGGVEVVAAGGLNCVSTYKYSVCPSTIYIQIQIHHLFVCTFGGWWGWRDRGGNYSNIFAIISKYLHQTSQIYFALSVRWRAAWRKYWIDTLYSRSFILVLTYLHCLFCSYSGY